MSFPRIARSCDHTFIASVLNPTSVIVDFGCNRGEFAHEIIARFGCSVYSAEPVRDLCLEIEPSPRLRLFQVAITGSNEPVVIKFHHRRNASILPELLHEAPAMNEIVEGVTLGEFLSRAELSEVDLAKVDIEGAELSMFDAASDSELERVSQWTIEFHDFIYPELEEHVVRVKERMKRLGFWCINMSLDNTDVMLLNPERMGLKKIHYLYLSSIVKYREGAKRRFRAKRERQLTVSKQIDLDR